MNKIILIFIFLIVIFFGCKQRPYRIQQPLNRPQQITDVKIILTGVFIKTSDVWTMNGDGWITMRIKGGQLVDVVIVGFGNQDPETEFRLKTVRYIQNLAGKNIIVEVKQHNKKLIATKLIEI